jgi:ABC-type dipeptide/oligopeptide/nickel transport system ATPase component
MPASAEHLLSVHNLRTYFYTFEGVARAVDGASFFLNKGEALGIVGESGCGKSVTASSIMRIVPEPPGRIVGGQILFQGEDLVKLSQKQMRKIRGQRIAMIFQEPMTSLNPVFTIGNQISEMFILHRMASRKAPWTQSIEMLDRVQIPAPERRIEGIPPPAFRRHAPAGHDRHGAGLRSRDADRRRADHGAGCDRAGPDSDLMMLKLKETSAPPCR